MQLNQLIKQHPSLAHAEEMLQICKPLQKLGISYFAHVRIERNGFFSGNGTRPDFLTHYLEQGYQNFDLHLGLDDPEQRYILWDALKLHGKTKQLYEAEAEFGFNHTITLVDHKPGTMELYHFSTKLGHYFMNAYYLQHLDLLEKFIAYFHGQLLLNDTLNEAYKMGFKVSNQGGGFQNKQNLILTQDTEIADFLEEIGDTKVPIMDPKMQTKVSRRERQCAFYLLEGYTSKEIAEKLYLSPRTVEVYLERLRTRFGSKNKIQLARHIIETNLLKQNS